jgi:hypothetical protein
MTGAAALGGGKRCPHATEGGSVADESGVTQRAAEQRRQFQETHGYPVVSVLEMWVGHNS